MVTDPDDQGIDSILGTDNTIPNNSAGGQGLSTRALQGLPHQGSDSESISEYDDNDDSDYQPSEADILLESYSLTATKWQEEMVRTPKIGGLHLGKIPILMNETGIDEEYRRNLIDFE